MSKFHINSAGEVGVCKATKGNCPFGGADSHFDTAEAAQAHLNKVNHEEYGILSTDESNLQSLRDINRDDEDEIAKYADRSEVSAEDLDYAINLGSHGREQYVKFIERAISNLNNRITDKDVVEAFSAFGVAQVRQDLIGASITRLSNKYKLESMEIGKVPIINDLGFKENSALEIYSDTASSDDLEWLAKAGVGIDYKNPNLNHNAILDLGVQARFDSEFESLYNHPNSTDETKEELIKRYPQFEESVNYKGSGMSRADFRDKITIDTGQERMNPNGTLNEYTFQLDKEMVDKYNLTKSDLDNVFGFSHGSEFNKETGIYKQTIDSSD